MEQMAKEKGLLRDSLFNKYFEVEEGLTLKELEESTRCITDTFEEFRKIIIDESQTFCSYNGIEKVSLINYKNKNYLFIKIMSANYYVIDLNLKKSLNDDCKSLFNIDFFIDNFDECIDGLDYDVFYHFDEYKGDINKLLMYFYQNKDILELKDLMIKYKIFKNDATTSIYYNIINGSGQLHFYANNQFLYEQLFLKRGLKPSNMQDAVQKIGRERINEMFEAIPNIKIPYEYIPKSIKIDSKKTLIKNNNIIKG